MKFTDMMDKFSGAPGEDVEHWIDRSIATVQVLEDTDDTESLKKKLVRLMPVLLQGAAYSTWKRLKESERSDYEAVAKALRRVYGKSKATAWAELKALKLAPGEQVDVMADQAETLLRIVAGTDALPPTNNST